MENVTPTLTSSKEMSEMVESSQDITVVCGGDIDTRLHTNSDISVKPYTAMENHHHVQSSTISEDNNGEHEMPSVLKGDTQYEDLCTVQNVECRPLDTSCVSNVASLTVKNQQCTSSVSSCNEHKPIDTSGKNDDDPQSDTVCILSVDTELARLCSAVKNKDPDSGVDDRGEDKHNIIRDSVCHKKSKIRSHKPLKDKNHQLDPNLVTDTDLLYSIEDDSLIIMEDNSSYHQKRSTDNCSTQQKDSWSPDKTMHMDVHRPRDSTAGTCYSLSISGYEKLGISFSEQDLAYQQRHRIELGCAESSNSDAQRKILQHHYLNESSATSYDTKNDDEGSIYASVNNRCQPSAMLNSASPQNSHR